MRPIKFRVWDKDNNEMIYNVGICPTGTPYKIDEGASYHDEFDYYENSILMQFTGLHDKTGKEIHEGDKVNCRMDFEGGSLPHMGEIVYDKTFGAFATKNQSGNTLLHNHCLNTFEIIGNIYEDKELLNDRQD